MTASEAKPAPAAVVDLFRFADGKIVEHPDVKQEMPPHPVSAHPFF